MILGLATDRVGVKLATSPISRPSGHPDRRSHLGWGSFDHFCYRRRVGNYLPAVVTLNSI
jgi:hypothetical protein